MASQPNIIVGEDCGNAPKKIFLQDLNIAFASGDHDSVLQAVGDGVVWELVGQFRSEGKEAFARALEQRAGGPVAELAIDNIITHGRIASANGAITLSDGGRHGFCHVYQFSGHGKNAKITSITSYVVPLPPP